MSKIETLGYFFETVKTWVLKLSRLSEQSRCLFWTVEITIQDWDHVKNQDFRAFFEIVKTWVFKLSRCLFLNCRDQKYLSWPYRDKLRPPSLNIFFLILIFIFIFLFLIVFFDFLSFIINYLCVFLHLATNSPVWKKEGKSAFKFSPLIVFPFQVNK